MSFEEAIKKGLVLVAYNKNEKLVDIMQFENKGAFRSVRWFLRNSKYNYRSATEANF